MPVNVRCPNPSGRKALGVPEGWSGGSLRCPVCASAVTLSRTATGVDTVGPSGPTPPGDAAWPFLHPPQEAGEIGRLGGSRVLGVLGQGGMGVVFRAEDPGLRRLVALRACDATTAPTAGGSPSPSTA